MKQEGVIVATDREQEWLLKWWWTHYRSSNSHPVTFFDLGMSKNARLWCEKRGEIRSFNFPEEWLQEVDNQLIEKWKNTYPGPILHKRRAWFSKPYVLFNTPYERALWFDLDCQVRRSIAPLFSYSIKGDGMSVVAIEHEGKRYQNSGVLAFRRYSPVVTKWAENARYKNHLYQGDDDLLVATIRENCFNVPFFPMTYNHPTILPGFETASVRHYVGASGKQTLLKQIEKN